MKRRRGKKRRTNPRILILVEGETERNYFLAIKQDPVYKKSLAALTIEIKKTKKQASKEMVIQAEKMIEEAKNYNNKFDSVWLVFDHDNNPKRKETWTRNKATNDINLIFSAIAFEQWYILHFKKSSKVFTNANTLIADLKNYYPNYAKAKQNDFLFLKNRLDEAINNAQWLRNNKKKIDVHISDQNPWTDVDKLVLYLLHLND